MIYPYCSYSRHAHSMCGRVLPYIKKKIFQLQHIPPWAVWIKCICCVLHIRRRYSNITYVVCTYMFFTLTLSAVYIYYFYNIAYKNIIYSWHQYESHLFLNRDSSKSKIRSFKFPNRDSSKSKIWTTLLLMCCHPQEIIIFVMKWA